MSNHDGTTICLKLDEKTMHGRTKGQASEEAYEDPEPKQETKPHKSHEKKPQPTFRNRRILREKQPRADESTETQKPKYLHYDPEAKPTKTPNNPHEVK